MDVGTDAPGALCSNAIRASEVTYRLPLGLLAAIGEVESGRVDATTGRLGPWPWTVQASGQSWYFASKEKAVQWVRAAEVRGLTSIDTGCLQVNLFFHPHAFNTLDDAFDPRLNVDYAARFLVRLYSATGNWRQATGFYHSQTSALAASYESRVERRLSDPLICSTCAPKQPTVLTRLASAWQSTLTPVSPPSTLLQNNWGMLLHQSPDAIAAHHLRVNTK